MAAEVSCPEAGAGKEALGRERRRAVRYPCLRHCLVRPDGGTGVGDWPGMTYNLSVSGVGLALPCPVGMGTMLTIEAFSGKKSKPLRARVVRSVLDAFVWFHGCELETPLTEEELRGWLP